LLITSSTMKQGLYLYSPDKIQAGLEKKANNFINLMTLES